MDFHNIATGLIFVTFTSHSLFHRQITLVSSYFEKAAVQLAVRSTTTVLLLVGDTTMCLFDSKSL